MSQNTRNTQGDNQGNSGRGDSENTERSNNEGFWWDELRASEATLWTQFRRQGQRG
jgi:hypothetical protein